MDIRHAVGVKEGISDEKLTDVLAYRESPHFNERERAALEFCERTIRDDLDVSDECMVRLREHFEQAEIVELAFMIGYQTFANKFAKSFRLAPQGFRPDHLSGFALEHSHLCRRWP
jgi:alkylhydroperoxidase family enzyme